MLFHFNKNLLPINIDTIWHTISSTISSNRKNKRYSSAKAIENPIYTCYKKQDVKNISVRTREKLACF